MKKKKNYIQKFNLQKYKYFLKIKIRSNLNNRYSHFRPIYLKKIFPRAHS